jgi:flagellin-like protein
MARNIRASRKGISPVIATVILVAVAITVAVSVAYWMGGISSLYTRLEKIEVSGTSVSKNAGVYTITMNIKNTGSADATVDNVYINGKMYNSADFTDNVTVTDGSTTPVPVSAGISVKSGSSAEIIITITPKAPATATVAPFTAGTTLDVKLHTAAGKDYPQMITLT